MDSVEAYQSPAIKQEPRWAARDDIMDRMPGNDGYRNRRSPGKITKMELISYQLLCFQMPNVLSFLASLADVIANSCFGLELMLLTYSPALD